MTYRPKPSNDGSRELGFVWSSPPLLRLWSLLSSSPGVALRSAVGGDGSKDVEEEQSRQEEEAVRVRPPEYDLTSLSLSLYISFSSPLVESLVLISVRRCLALCWWWGCVQGRRRPRRSRPRSCKPRDPRWRYCRSHPLCSLPVKLFLPAD